DLEELWTRHAQDQDRSVSRPVCDVIDNVQQGRLGPVDVIEDGDDGTLRRKRLQQAADRPAAFEGRVACEPDDRRELGAHRLGVWGSTEKVKDPIPGS